MVADNLPILQVVMPLLAAPLCIVIRNGTLSWALALSVTWAAFAIAITLLFQVLDGGSIVYAIGGWAAPWGIEYRVDTVNAFVLVIVSAIGSVVMVFAKASIAAEVAEDRICLFYTLYILCLTGLLGITITGDVFNLFVFLEISSLSAYAMVSLGQDRRALLAAYRYLMMGTIGATFYIIGVGMMYMMSGTLNIADLSTIIPAIADTRTILVALAFICVGISLKLALFPLHLWLPDAYTYAPSAVTAFIAATATKVAVYVMIRILFTVFGVADVFSYTPIGDVLMTLAIAAMFVASAVAIYQTNIKRMLAYSSIAQIGYMILGISFSTVTGMTGGIVHLFNHALTKSALFMVMGCVFMRLGSVNIRDFHGMGKRMPITMAAFVVAGLSLIGTPLTVGFISKWYLVRAAMENDSLPIAVLILLSSLLAVIYVWRVVEVAYFRPVPEGAVPIKEAPMSMLVPMWVMSLATIYFGINATGTIEIAATATASLLKGIQ